jgi:hypothetical protein
MPPAPPLPSRLTTPESTATTAVPRGAMMSIALWTRVAPRASVKLSAMEAGSMSRTGNARSRASSSAGGCIVAASGASLPGGRPARSRTTRCTIAAATKSVAPINMPT